MEKDINFYKYDIVVEQDLNLSFLDTLEDKNIEPEKINGEIIKIEDFQKIKYSNRFFGLYFQSGDLYNYSPDIIDTKDDLKRKNNPRKNTQIEFDKQFFFLIDINKKNIYLSDCKHKTFISEWLKKKTGYVILLKVILDEKTFNLNLKKISEINFTFKNEKTLFNTNTLNNKLLEDLYDYGADSISISFKYKRNVTDKIKEKYLNLIKRKEDYKNLKIIGKDDKDVDLIFNPDGILSKITMKEALDPDTKKFTADSVFNTLILRIKKYE